MPEHCQEVLPRTEAIKMTSEDALKWIMRRTAETGKEHFFAASYGQVFTPIIQGTEKCVGRGFQAIDTWAKLPGSPPDATDPGSIRTFHTHPHNPGEFDLPDVCAFSFADLADMLDNHFDGMTVGCPASHQTVSVDRYTPAVQEIGRERDGYLLADWQNKLFRSLHEVLDLPPIKALIDAENTIPTEPWDDANYPLINLKGRADETEHIWRDFAHTYLPYAPSADTASNYVDLWNRLSHRWEGEQFTCMALHDDGKCEWLHPERIEF